MTNTQSAPTIQRTQCMICLKKTPNLIEKMGVYACSKSCMNRVTMFGGMGFVYKKKRQYRKIVGRNIILKHSDEIWFVRKKNPANGKYLIINRYDPNPRTVWVSYYLLHRDWEVGGV